MYLQVRADPALDARTLGAMDLEAREYLEYLEAREAAAAAVQKPLGTTVTPTAIVPSHTEVHAEIKSPELYKAALADRTNNLHRTRKTLSTRTPSATIIAKRPRSTSKTHPTMPKPCRTRRTSTTGKLCTATSMTRRISRKPWRTRRANTTDC
ncbi:hypothetical protein BYT27DRAFT_6778627 [Phlegmacium glaucopus]|nr:hypothetical protein BYT27DRAFT_6778627 [Phlegmacium glaucopus]